MTFSTFIVPNSSGIAPPTLDIKPTWYKSSIKGGCVAAELRAEGGIEQLWVCADMVGRRIIIFDERSQRAWWGMINEVSINIDGVVFGFTFDGMANRIAVTYSVVGPDGTSERKTTNWLSNTDSVNKFGTKDLMISMGESSDELADAKQNLLLYGDGTPANPGIAWPIKIESFDGQDGKFATLHCVGWYETLKWRYFERLEGRIEFEGGVDTPGIRQAIGWGHTSNLIHFEGPTTTYTRTITGATNANPIVVTTSVAHGLNAGDVITISGVTGNTAANGTFKIRDVTSTTFALTDQTTGDGVAGNGGYVSGGTMSKTITNSGPSKIIYGKPITGATNATPIVITCPSHGFANNDIVTISEVEGNTEANGTFKIASVTTNTFALLDRNFGTNIAGTHDYAVGGVVSKDAIAGPFLDLVDGQIITVTGSASNNGSYTIFGNSSGNGKYLEVYSTLTTETAGASVTVSLVGQKIAQQYVQSHSFELWRVGIPVTKVGSPTDNLQVRILTDSSNSPGSTVIATCIIPGSSIGTSSSWYWILSGTNPTMTASASYWLEISRTGSVNDTNYYLLEMDATASQNCKAWNGAAWVAHPNANYVPNRVWGWEDTITQVQRILTDCGAFLTGGQDIALTSGIKSNQYRNGDLTAYDEIDKLLEIGNSAGRRFVIYVTNDRTARITLETVASEGVDILTDNNEIRTATSGWRARGDLPVGEWIIIDKVPLHLNAVYNLSPIFVEEAEYDIEKDKLRLTHRKR